MSKVWKRIVACMMVLCMVAGCTACSSKGSSSKKESSDKSKVIKVGWYTAWYLSKDYYDKLFDNFQTMYPDYKIEKTDVQSVSDLVSQVQSGTQPDCWLGGDPNNTNLTVGYYEGVFHSIDKYLKKDKTVNLKTLDPEQMKLTEYNGKYYGLPVHSTQQCLIYNKKLFAEAGLDPNHAPETWEEFYKYAKKLTKYDSNGFITQLGVTNGPWVYQLENSNGSTGTFKNDRISSNYDSNWVLKLHEFCNKCATITENKSAKKDVELDFSKGNVAMTIGDFQSLSDVEMDRDNMGIAYVPKPEDVKDNYIPSLLFYFIGIPEGCSNPDGGWIFMKYLLTDGAYLQNSESYLKNPKGFIPQQIAHIPTKKKVYKEFEAKVSNETKKFIEQRDKLLENADIVVENYSPIQSTLTKIQDKWSKKMNNGEVSQKEALQGIHKEYEVQLATWKKQQMKKGWKFPKGKEAIAPEK